MDQRFDPGALRTFADDVLRRAGLPAEPAEAVARGLVEGDLYGHVTHGLALLEDYVAAVDNGTMERDGRPEVLADAGAAATWDARRLPGVWTTMLAVDDAVARAGRYGLGAVAIRRSHHIACLAAYLEAPARAGNLILVFSSDPATAHVAAYGGLDPIVTPDPVAAGIPAAPDPILIDVSMSITTAGMAGRLRATGGRFPEKWLLDRDGTPTDDPWALKNGGSILPIGGLDHGHKGFGLALLVEALTQGPRRLRPRRRRDGLGRRRPGARLRPVALRRHGRLPPPDDVARRRRARQPAGRSGETRPAAGAARARPEARGRTRRRAARAGDHRGARPACGEIRGAAAGGDG